MYEYQLRSRKISNADMMNMFKKALTKFSKLKLKNVFVDMSISLETPVNEMATSFNFTVFNDTHNNATFSFYSFWDKDDIEKRINDFFTLIKQDDFKKVKNTKEGME